MISLLCSMRRFFLLAVLTLLLALSGCGNDGSNVSFKVSFPEKPVALFDNADAGLQVLSYFNIVKVGENDFRMYYSGIEPGDSIKDFNHNLYIATSNDLLHWSLENPHGGSNLLMRNIVEQSVCYIKGDEFPYRLIGNIWEDNRYKMCMWFSKDGIEFVNRKVVLEDRMHDSQCVLVPEDGFFKLYYRQSVKLGPGNYNRRIVLRHIDMEGNSLTDMQFIAGERLYNSAATRLDDRFDLLLPTYFNNEPGLGDPCHLTVYIQNGLYSQQIDCPLNEWIEEDEKWELAAPGIIEKDGKKYVAYYTRNTSHDEGRIDRSVIKLVEIRIESGNYGRKAEPGCRSERGVCGKRNIKSSITMKEVSLDVLGAENPFDLIGEQWMLITAGNKDSFNTMTASWGGVGWLWNKPVAFIFVRPERYTHDFLENSDKVTLSFFPESCRRALQICGTRSGRDCDKVAEAGLAPLELESGAMTFEQARMTVEGRKLFKSDMKEAEFVDKEVYGKWYGDAGLHTVYVLEIVKVWTH